MTSKSHVTNFDAMGRCYVRKLGWNGESSYLASGEEIFFDATTKDEAKVIILPLIVKEKTRFYKASLCYQRK